MSQRSAIRAFSKTAVPPAPAGDFQTPTLNVSPEPASRRKRALGMLITPVLFVLALVGGHRAWAWYAQHQFGNFVTDLRKNGEPVSLAEIIPTQVPDSANAVADVRRAIEQIVVERDESTQAFFNLPGLELPMTRLELLIVRPTVAINQQSLATVREAMTRPAADWMSITPGSSQGTPAAGWRGPGYMRQRGLLQLLYAGVLLAHTEGREVDALQHVDELLFLASTTARRPTVRAQRSAARMTEISLGALSELIPDLQIGSESGQAPPPRVRQLIAHLLDERELRESFLLAFRAERARQIDALTLPGESVRADGTVIDPYSWGELLPMPQGGTSGLEQFMWRPVYLANVTHALEQVSVGLQSLRSANYREFLHSFGDRNDDGSLNDGDEDAQEQAAAPDNAAHLLNSEIESAGRSYYICLAERRAAALALAICLYRADHEGKFPPVGLGGVAPQYIPAIPIDPLSTAGDALGYALDDSRPRVYSVGEDGIDDGGWPADTNATQSSERRMTDYVIDLKRQPRQALPPAITTPRDFPSHDFSRRRERP